MDTFLHDVSTALTERERSVVSIDNVSAPPLGITNTRLLCRVYSKRGFNPNQLKNFLHKHWLGRFEVIISDYDSESYMVTFGCEGDLKRVLSKEPWHFHNQHLILCPPSVLLSDSLSSYTTTPFWVQVYRLPFLSKSEALAKIIGNLIGEFLEVHNDSLNEGWGPFLRIRVGLDVSKPLLRGQMVSLPWMRDELWIDYRYERLPDFCYECGIIGHVFDNCKMYMEKIDEGIEPGLEYGPWMAGSPLPRSSYDRYRQDFSKSGPWPFITRLARNTINPIISHPSQPPVLPPTVTSREKGSNHVVSTPDNPGNSHQQLAVHPSNKDSINHSQIKTFSASSSSGAKEIASVPPVPVSSSMQQNATNASNKVVKEPCLQRDHMGLADIKGKRIVDDVPVPRPCIFQPTPFRGQVSSSSSTISIKDVNEYPPGYLPKKAIALPVATPPVYLHHLHSANHLPIPSQPATNVKPPTASSLAKVSTAMGEGISTENSSIHSKSPCTFTKRQMINQGGNVRQVLKRCRTKDTSLADITNAPQHHLPEPISELAAISLVEEESDISLAKAESQPRQSP
ncbi:hypothetical protein CsatA_029789 [Cannabis sativa]